jgi:hypothetical protein
LVLQPAHLALSDGLCEIEAGICVDYTKGKESHRLGIEKGTTGGGDSMLGNHFPVPTGCGGRWFLGLDKCSAAVCTCRRWQARTSPGAWRAAVADRIELVHLCAAEEQLVLVPED